ncbi:MULTISPECIES: PQQ-binding-like beta-propeller repeat protein [Haloarcula]|uniref:outer membrane protein assembly factor BamB family protein n=1 Tax=Haloarcula TaxID=2237 RepID=UPI000F8F125F|nr:MULTISPECIES: PQQ-binding-like beta-propeller repeat protein [Haloarcula]NHX41396.1 PQQ-binding-like beta-propeller repeat protein [Haloarcula sp. R1-2]
MATNDYVYAQSSSDPSALSMLNKNDGSVANTVSVTSNEIKSVETDFDGNIYVGTTGDEVVKYNSYFNEQWRVSNGAVNQIILSKDLKQLYAGSFGVTAYDIDTGNIVWENSEGYDSILDITIGPEDYIYYSDQDSFAIRVDPGTGNTDSTWEVEDGYQNKCGLTWIDGYFFVADNAGYLRKYSGWKGTKEFGKYYSDFISNISRHEDGSIYIGDSNEDVWKIDSDGSVIWNVPASEDRDFIRSVSVDRDGSVYVGDAGGYIHKLNATDGSTEWESSNAGMSVYAGSISAFPKYDTYVDGLWFTKMDLSGTATLSGNAAENAKIIAIDEGNNRVAERTQADANGNWSLKAKGQPLHLIAQYTDSDGNKYSATSYPFID